MFETKKLVAFLIMMTAVLCCFAAAASALDTSEAALVIPDVSAGSAEVPFFYDYNGKRLCFPQKATCLVNTDGQSISFKVTVPIKSGYMPVGLNQRDGVIWNDDRIEVFLQPNGSGSFYQFILNVAGAVYDSRDRDKGWNGNPETKITINPDNWQAEIKVPFSLIGFDPAKGNIIRGNVAVASNEPGNIFCLTWIKLPVDFLHVESFGVWKLSNDLPYVEKVSISDTVYDASGAHVKVDYTVRNPAKSDVTANSTVISAGSGKSFSRDIILAGTKLAVLDIGLGDWFAYKSELKNGLVPTVELNALDTYHFTVIPRNAEILTQFADSISLTVDGNKVLNCRLADLPERVIDTSKWAEGDHKFAYEFLDKSGKTYSVLNETVYTFKPAKPEYDISKLDASRYYPNVKYGKGQLSAARSVFDLASGIIPHQIKVNGLPVLDNGVQIVFDGKTLPINGKVKKVSANKNRVKLVSVSKSGNKTITVSAVHDYDGFTWYEVSIKSSKAFGYGPLSVVLPMKLDSDIIVGYETLYWDALFGKEKITNIGAPTDLRGPEYDNKYLTHGRMLKADENLTLPLSTFVSLSTDTDENYKGLGFSTEGPVGWNMSNYDKTYEIVRGTDGKVNMTVNISDGKKRLRTKEIKFAFGLEPFPMRKFPKDFHADYRIDCTFAPKLWKPYVDEKTGKMTDFFERIKADGVRTELVHESWTVFENYWKAGSNEYDMQMYVDGAKKAGIDLFFYFGFLLSDKIPEFSLYHDLVFVKPNSYPDGGFRPYVYYKQGDPDQNSWSVCYKSIWGSRFAMGIAEAIKKYNLRGVYYDGTLVAGGCANTKHGCGTVDPYGRLIVTFPVRAYRRQGEIVYYEGLKVRPDFQVDHHVGYPYPPAMGLIAAYWTGEASHLFEPISARTSPDTLRGMFNGRLYGVPSDHLTRPETNINTAWAQALLVDVYPRLTEGGGDVFTYLHKMVWGIHDKYKLTADTFTPYWVKANKIVTDNSKVLVSYYDTEKALVAVVSTYWCNEPQKVTVDVNAFKGLKPRCYDAWAQKNYDMPNGKVTLELVGQHLALLVIEKE